MNDCDHHHHQHEEPRRSLGLAIGIVWGPGIASTLLKILAALMIFGILMRACTA